MTLTKSLIVISMLAGSAQVALADSEEQIGNWTVSTRPQEGKVPSVLCVLRSAKSEDGVALQLANGIYRDASTPTTRGNAGIFFYIDKLASDQERAEFAEAKVSVDSRVNWPVPVKWAKLGDNNGVLTATLDSEVDRVIKPLAFGNNVIVTYPNASGGQDEITVSLAGSSKALASYEKCLATIGSN